MALKKLVICLLAPSILLACAALTGGSENSDPTPTSSEAQLGLNPPTLAPPTSAVPTLDVQSGESCQDFNNGQIAFQCPPGWDLHTDRQTADPIPGLDLGGEFVIAVVDPEQGGNYSFQRGVLIFSYPLPQGTTLDEFQREVYAGLEHFYPVDQKESSLTIAGQQAVQSCYRVFWGEPAYEFCDTWLADGDQAYLITSRTEYTNPEDTAQAAAEMQSLVESFRFVD
jgi:hypothetical protein